MGNIRTEGAGPSCPFSACSMEQRRLPWICCSCVLVTLNCCKHSCTWEEASQLWGGRHSLTSAGTAVPLSHRTVLSNLPPVFLGPLLPGAVPFSPGFTSLPVPLLAVPLALAHLLFKAYSKLLRPAKVTKKEATCLFVLHIPVTSSQLLHPLP